MDAKILIVLSFILLFDNCLLAEGVGSRANSGQHNGVGQQRNSIQNNIHSADEALEILDTLKANGRKRRTDGAKVQLTNDGMVPIPQSDELKLNSDPVRPALSLEDKSNLLRIRSYLKAIRSQLDDMDGAKRTRLKTGGEDTATSRPQLDNANHEPRPQPYNMNHEPQTKPKSGEQYQGYEGDIQAQPYGIENTDHNHIHKYGGKSHANHKGEIEHANSDRKDEESKDFEAHQEQLKAMNQDHIAHVESGDTNFPAKTNIEPSSSHAVGTREVSKNKKTSPDQQPGIQQQITESFVKTFDVIKQALVEFDKDMERHFRQLNDLDIDHFNMADAAIKANGDKIDKLQKSLKKGMDSHNANVQSSTGLNGEHKESVQKSIEQIKNVTQTLLNLIRIINDRTERIAEIKEKELKVALTKQQELGTKHNASQTCTTHQCRQKGKMKPQNRHNQQNSHNLKLQSIVPQNGQSKTETRKHNNRALLKNSEKLSPRVGRKTWKHKHKKRRKNSHKVNIEDKNASNFERNVDSSNNIDDGLNNFESFWNNNH